MLHKRFWFPLKIYKLSLNCWHRVTGITCFEKYLGIFSYRTMNFYQNLVQYRFKNIYGSKGIFPRGILLGFSLHIKKSLGFIYFHVLGPKIVKHLRRRRSYPGAIEKTIGHVLGPSADMYRLFKRCTLTVKAMGDFMMGLVQTSPEATMSQDWPLWLLVGTPTVLVDSSLPNRRNTAGFCAYHLIVFLCTRYVLPVTFMW